MLRLSCLAGRNRDADVCVLAQDPLANSFISAVTEDPTDDPRLTTEAYERDAEEDETYGIDHLKKEEAKEAAKLAASTTSSPAGTDGTQAASEQH